MDAAAARLEESRARLRELENGTRPQEIARARAAVEAAKAVVEQTRTTLQRRERLPASLAVFLLSSIGVGLMISAYARTQQQAIIGAFLFLMPAVILSGFATPIENMPAFIQWLTYADPLRYFLVILRGLFLRDLPLELALDRLWPMAVIGAVTGGLAIYLFQRRLA